MDKLQEELFAEMQAIREDLARKDEEILALNTKIDNRVMQLEYPPTEQDSLVIKEVAGSGSSYIWGDVASSGTPYTITSGVTVTKTGTGAYTINHSIGKTICLLVVNYPADTNHYTSYTASYNDNVITLNFYRNGSAYDVGFYFIAFPQT